MFQQAIEELQAGRATICRPRGTSMRPLIESGDEVLLVPVDQGRVRPPTLKPRPLRHGDAVLVKVKGSIYLHLVKAVEGNRVLIGNNRGHINGWTTVDKVYGCRWTR